MRWLTAAAQKLRARVLARAASAEPRSLLLAVARSGLAVATATALVFTRDGGLFVYLPSQRAALVCQGPTVTSLWCLGGTGSAAMLAHRLVALAVLGAVAIGLSPRWTCIPHWYVTFSLGSAMTLPNGGEVVARVATLLLIPLCLGDPRVWQWTRPPTPLSAAWRGASYAGALVLRAQVSLIYLDASLSKLRENGWRHGTYLRDVFTDPYYGAPSWLAWLTGPLSRDTVALHVATWGVIATEIAIALCVWASRSLRLLAFCLAAALHVGIIALVGLPSFGLVMISIVALAAAPTRLCASAYP